MNLDQYLKDNILVFMLILETFFTFIAAIFVDKIRVFFLENVEKKIINKILNIKDFVLKYKSAL